MDQDSTLDETPTPVGRRVMLQGAALTGVAAVLAACGKDSGAGGSSAPPAGGGSQETTPAAGSSPTKSEPTPLAATADIPVDGGVIDGADKIVITQPEAGTFKAFTAVCTHAGCIVSSVSDGAIHCACHGSSYSVADGSVITGPATSPLAAIAIKVKSGEVFPD